MDRRKTRMQHLQKGKAFEVDLVNDEGKPVCCMCETTFEKMKSLHDHMVLHSDGDWEIFFTTQRPEKAPTVYNAAKVVHSPLRWTLTGKRQKRGRPALQVDDDNVKVYKVQKVMEENMDSMKLVIDLADLEAAESLLLLRYGRPEASVSQRKIQAEECEGFLLDLNQPPPMDMEAEVVDHSHEEFTGGRKRVGACGSIDHQCFLGLTG